MADLPAWTRSLRRAAFRGVQFHTADRGFESGRRIHNHEYPKRNSNFPEDMGKRTREWSIDAYVIGDDYQSKRNDLIRACEDEGPGSYTDHWGLNSRVVCTKIKVKETSQEGRFVRFDIDFMEAASGNFAPVAIAATAAQLTTSTGTLIEQVLADFRARHLK